MDPCFLLPGPLPFGLPHLSFHTQVLAVPSSAVGGSLWPCTWAVEEELSARVGQGEAAQQTLPFHSLACARGIREPHRR